MDDFNLHLTGDIHAITAANNLLAAQIGTVTIKGKSTRITVKMFSNYVIALIKVFLMKDE